MVYDTVNNLFRKLKRKTGKEKVNESGYVPPKPAHRWQRRKRHEEKLEQEKKEQITESKIDPWFERSSNRPSQNAIALFSLPGDIESEQLHIEAGDELEVETFDRSDTWWKVTLKNSEKRGYVPRQFLTEEKGIKDILSAWFEIDRRECEAKLSMPDLPDGTYIIRPSSNPLRIALSVLSVVNGQRSIRHFSLKHNGTVSGYFISPTLSFQHLKDLTDYYSTKEHRSLHLSKPMPRHAPAVQIRGFWIPPEKVELQTKLTRGGHFGGVYKATCHCPLKQSTAVKKVPSHYGHSCVEKTALICHRLHHSAIVHFLGLVNSTKTEPMLLVWEFMPGGCLRDYLLQHKGDIDSRRLKLWLHQVLDGMDYLEADGCFHGEVCASNVFLSYDLCAKIGNFQFNALFGRTKANHKYFMESEALRWAAPELYDASREPNIRSDVWSFGVLIFEVFAYGSTPYDGVETKQLVQKVTSGLRPQNPADLGFCFDDTLVETMSSCLYYDPFERPTFRELWLILDEQINLNPNEYAEIH